MKTIRMATALLYPLAPCRAHGGRATVQERYTAIPYSLQSLSLRIINEAATPNESSAAFFISFLLAIRIAWTGFEGASAHRQPQGSARSVYTLRMLAFGNWGRLQIRI